MVSRKSSSSSNKTSTSTDTMIETIGKPQTVNTSYTSSHDFIPSRPPPPPKIGSALEETEENTSSSQSSKVSKQDKLQEFSKKLFKKTSSSSLNKKTFYQKLRGKEKKKQRIHGTGVDKNIQTDDITNSLTLDMLDVKKKREKKYRENVTLSLKTFLDSNILNGAVDSFKDYVENSLI